MTGIGIIGSGHIGGNLARLFTAAGHDVLVSFSTGPARLARLAAATGATAGTPAQAAAHNAAKVPPDAPAALGGSIWRRARQAASRWD